MNSGRLKVRGIEMRRGDTPRLISNLQGDMLGKLAEAKDASGFYRKIPEAVQVLKGYAQKLADNECAPADLVFKTHVSRGCGDYRQFNNQAAALMQYRQEGIEIQPGQSVSYIITDHRSKSCQKRVKIPELADETTGYDRAKYYEHLLRAAESILLPFGYTERNGLTGW